MSVTSRRDFVAALLGAPVALAACERLPKPLPDGELLLPGKRDGHRLRDRLRSPGAGRLEVARGRWLDTQVAIVGAGAAGLSAAWWLRRHGGKDLLVLDVDDAPGGTARWSTSPVTAYPWGAHYVVAPSARQPVLTRLLDEVGAVEEQAPGRAPVMAEHHLCREPEERLFYRGRWYEGLYLRAGADASDLEQLERFQREVDRWVGHRDDAGRRAFDLPTAGGSDSAEVRALDRISFATWLDSSRLVSPRLRWLTNYACRDDYGLLERDTSAWAGIAYFASRVERPRDAPRPVVTWPEGNGRLIEHLATGLGPRLRLEHAVAHVEERAGVRSEPGAGAGPRSGGGDADGRGPGVSLRASTPDGAVGVRARHAILATPLFVTRAIVPALQRGPRPRVDVDRGAWAVANLHLSGRPRERPGDAPLSWDNVIRDSPSLGYVVATHQRGRDHGPSVLSWYYPFTGDGGRARRELDAASRADWAAVALADVARAHPDLQPLCERIDVAYWGHGMVRPRPGTVFDPALRAAREPLGRLHFAVSELSGVSLFEEALDHGVRAAQEVLEQRRAGA